MTHTQGVLDLRFNGESNNKPFAYVAGDKKFFNMIQLREQSKALNEYTTKTSASALKTFIQSREEASNFIFFIMNGKKFQMPPKRKFNGRTGQYLR